MVLFQKLSLKSKQNLFQVIGSFSLLGLFILNFISPTSIGFNFVEGLLTGWVIVFGYAFLITYGKRKKQIREETTFLETN